MTDLDPMKILNFQNPSKAILLEQFSLYETVDNEFAYNGNYVTNLNASIDGCQESITPISLV